MKFSVVFLLLLGVVAAICAAVLVAFAVTRGSATVAIPGHVEPVQQEQQVTVLVARRSLPAMTVVDEECVSAVHVLKSKAPADSYASSVQINGKPLSLPMVAGQAFTVSCFEADGSRAKFASTLDNGKRAFAIDISDHGALDGILYPGSIVDVLTSAKLQNGDAFSTTLLSAVEVLAIEKVTIVSPDLAKRLEADTPVSAGPVFNTATSGTPGSVSGHRVTLRVDQKQAKTLQVAMENGSLALALRNPLDPSETVGNPVSLSSALGLDRMTARETWTKVLSNMMEKLSTARIATPMPSPTPAPTTAPAAPMWETTILRGNAVETQRFTMPPEEAAYLGRRT